jgi:8-amino-7-oxononanoate synthase
MDLEALCKQRLAALPVQRFLPSLFKQEGRLPPFLEQGFGAPLLHLGSNDYLGLSQHPKVLAAATEALEKWGAGVGSSRLLAGAIALTETLENELAQWLATEAALVFPSGYQANLALLQSLCQKEDWVLMDKLNHASLVDGLRLSGAQWKRYKHLDLNDLEAKLQQVNAKRKAGAQVWVASDSLFSMDGDWPDLQALLILCERYEAYLILDEAHALGVLGEKQGGGLLETTLNASTKLIGQERLIRMGTFSKALGGFGAFVVGSQALKDLLINTARGFIYTTGLPPAVIAAALAAVQISQQEPVWRQTLASNSVYLHQQLSQHAALCRLVPTSWQAPSPILPLVLGGSDTAVQWQHKLLKSGFYVPAIRPPTVGVGQARLRLSLTALHTKQQLHGLVQALSQCSSAI